MREETENILRASYTDTSAAAHGIYVQAAQDFTAEFVYTAPDGTELSKSLEVKVSERRHKPDRHSKERHQHLCSRAHTPVHDRQDHLHRV